MKLLLLDKDQTLVTPASGAQFVQSPEDQILLPGVDAALNRYVANGFTPVIVSNQGGVEVRSVSPTQVESGYINGVKIEGVIDGWEDGRAYTKFCMADGSRVVDYNDDQVHAFQYKTLDDAIAEMRYCMSLLPSISLAYFCPDSEGNVCWEIGDGHWRVEWNRHSEKMQGFYSFRKPEPGMIQLATDPQWGIPASEVIFVGDRPEDEQAAIAAHIPFIWADEWRKGA